MSAPTSGAAPLRRISAPGLAEPPAGTFSHCLVAGDVIYVSGQHGEPGAGGDFTTQAREAFRRLIALVRAAGGSPASVVKLTAYLTDISKRPEFGAVRREFFADPFPCSTLVEISALAAPDLLVEIEAIAIREGEAR